MKEYYDQLAAWYKPGNIIRLFYWQSYDKVISFNRPGTLGTDWDVTVIHCDIHGNPLEDAKARNHCTQPDWRYDQQVINGELMPPPEERKFTLSSY